MNYFSKLFRSSRRKRRGQSVLEVALMSPFLFVFLLSVGEFAALYMTDQQVTAISRELSNGAFARCATLEDAELDDCVNTVITTVFNSAGDVLPGFADRGGLVLSMYEPGAGFSVVRSAIQQHGPHAGQTAYPLTRFDPDLVRDAGVVVVGEAFFTHQTFTAMERLLNNMLAGVIPTELYEATVF